jgi:hypothetical protein
MPVEVVKKCGFGYQYSEWLSQNRLADPYSSSDNAGFILASKLSGFHTNFDGAFLEDIVTPGTYIATIPNNGLANAYRIHGQHGQALFVRASAVVAAFTGAGAGITPGGSEFKFSFADADVAGADNIIVVTQTSGTLNFNSVPSGKHFRYSFDVNAWNNRSLAGTKAKMEIGLIGTAHANIATALVDGPQAASNPACYVQFSENKMRLVVNTTASSWVEIPSNWSTFSVTVEYRNGKAAFLYLNSKRVATVSVAILAGSMQVFARAGHFVGYTALTDAPLDFRLDAISVAFEK